MGLGMIAPGGAISEGIVSNGIEGLERVTKVSARLRLVVPACLVTI